MAANTTSNKRRDWEWTPPKAMNTVMSTILRTPLLHRALSGMMLLITFTGRKSGKTYTTPVGYHQDGNTVIILTKRFRKWWRNFEEPAPVTLRLRGQDVTGEAVSLTDTEAMLPYMVKMIEAAPRQADIFEVEIDNGKVNLESARALAPKVVIIRVTV